MRIFRECAQFLVAALRPVGDLVVDDVDLLEALLDLLVVTVDQGEVLVHLDKLSVVRVKLGRVVSLFVSGVDLELLETLGQLFVVLFELVDLGLVVANGLQEGGVGLLTLLETSYHCLHISHTSVSLDLFESFIDATRGLHLLVHLLLHEIVPQFVNVQVVSHFELCGVLALIGGGLSDLLIFLLALNTAFY